MEASDNIMKVCRLCLTMDTKMYNISKYNLHQVFINITGLSVTLNSNFPQSLCWECTQRLRSAENLRLKAETSHNLLLDLFQLEKVVTLEHIKSINRYSYGLQSSLASKINENDNFDLTIDGDEKVFEEKIEVNLNEDVFDDLDQSKPIEVKVESNEIFFEDCGFVSEDDRTLSEVCKVKKVKKVKVKKKVKKDSEKLEEDDATTVADKFKTTDVKRRRTNENIDENLFTITMLSYEQQIEQITKRKESVLYKNATYKCELCFRGFHIKARYDAHSIRHRDESGAFECFICKSRLKTSRALRKHITSQHTEQFSCRGCPFITMNRGVAREHEKWHSGAKYQCPHCPSQFDKVTTYLGHVRIKHVSDFVCELCGYTFLSKKGIEVHKKKKHRLSEETCGAQLRGLRLYAQHFRRVHPDKNRTKYPAMKTPSMCEQCGRIFQSMALLKDHMWVHTGEKRFKCDRCDKSFTQKTNLVFHMRVHSATRPTYECPLCGKHFAFYNNRRRHMFIHTGLKPFKCETCGKAFTTSGELRAHVEHVHLKKPWPKRSRRGNEEPWKCMQSMED
ncbi:zinc finger protein 99 isoform X2 [Pieris rapae]|uniref:zinc finger protein 99 isoform X2 n=1 Tax=Pieris rapae TaxID=64459 RepID=UPI001E27DE74|nr:zinc finger protein 99 isoform X2 [Pieris rapae]